MLGLLCSTWAVSGLNCPLACGILVLRPEIEHLSLSLEGGFLTTGPLGKFHSCGGWKSEIKVLAWLVSGEPPLHGWSVAIFSVFRRSSLYKFCVIIFFSLKDPS